MVLALLEQMEVLSGRKPLLVFMLLGVLKRGERGRGGGGVIERGWQERCNEVIY